MLFSRRCEVGTQFQNKFSTVSYRSSVKYDKNYCLELSARS